MEPRLSLDTTFLIDLQKERARDTTNRAAHRYLRENANSELYLSVVALGEFAEGFDDIDNPVVRTVRDSHTPIPVDESVALVYSQVTRYLRSRGELIGANDLWIGCSSLNLGLPLVTANTEHLRRIPDLKVIDYRDQTGPPNA